jgi:hypothetical protein
MNPKRLKIAVTYLAGWGLAVFFVTLLSFIFSFLGTIFCAAVAGMMLGTTRQARVLALPTSVIFPGVVFALLRGMKSDLPLVQVTEVAAACFGAFWLVFGLAVGLVACERKGAATPPGARANRRAGTVAVTPGVINASVRGDLRQLDGRWLEEAAAAKLQESKRVLEIKRGQLELNQVERDGRARLLVRGEVRLDPWEGVTEWVMI